MKSKNQSYENYLKALEIFHSPKNQSDLEFDSDNQCFSDNLGSKFPVIDGIICFLPELLEEDYDSYKKLSKNYDKQFYREANIFWKTWVKFAWNIDDNVYADAVFSYIPSDFKGILLDIPTGTGFFTQEFYPKIKNDLIICADYSIEMLKWAQMRYKKKGVTNVVYIQTDVTNLPIKSEMVDLVLSMNGYHAFRNKVKALAEFSRVCKKGGKFVCCTYVKGIRKLTDFVMHTVYQMGGWFSKPHPNKTEFYEQLLVNFRLKQEGNAKSIIHFSAIKK